MKFYPAYLDLRDRPCLVIGGGAVAERKALSLLEAGAEVTIVSPSLTPKLQELSVSGKITHHRKTFDEQDLVGEALVVAATSSHDVNVFAARACKKRHILVNVAAPPEESTFIVPSLVERGELLIAVSTTGVSPALAKRIRQELERQYGTEYELFLEKFATIRARVLHEVTDERTRRKIFQAIADSDAIELFRMGRLHEAEARMLELAGLSR
ncbi:MAG: bifunctional precorrin-2 dehydrogenase/sirohydrochlorin ferrochelatase [Nitrospirota bacterium]|jgi:precorrin-2 dehydrogenase/sirohydrochlorin ferrochelatase